MESEDFDLARYDAMEGECLVDRYARKEEFRDAAKFLSCLHSTFNDPKRWAFRGQRNSRWPLSPVIERVKQHGAFWSPLEEQAYQAFLKRARQRSGGLHGDILSNLALMRHHGGPTRLLDFTTQSEIAALFAVEDPDATKAPSVVWVLDRLLVNEEADRLLSDSGISYATESGFLAFFQDSWPPVVRFVEPRCPCDRQLVQSGLFLCPNTTGLGYGLELGLKNVLQRAAANEEYWLHKIVILPEARDELLEHLLQKGISHDRLFEGLDGLGRALTVEASLRSTYFDRYYPNGLGTTSE